MRKFFIFFFISGLSLFLIDRGLAFFFDHLYVKIRTGQTGGKINSYLSQPSAVQLVILGNSRALYQVIPDSFKIPAYNLSHAGMSQIFQTGLVSVLHDNVRMPRIILIHLEPEEFNGEQYNNDIQNLKFYYSRNELITSYLQSLSYFEKFKFYFHSYRYNGRVIPLTKNYFQTIRTPGNDNGYSLIRRTEKDSINTIYSSKNLSRPVEEKFNFEQWSYFEKFLDICKQTNTRVICFTSPVYKDSSSYLNTTKTIDSLMKKNNIRYINYMNSPITELNQHPSFWRDRYHLNHEGARIESEYLARNVNEVIQANSSSKNDSIPPL